jgi:hypothetical protein
MHVLAIRRPGQRGTLKLVERFGDRLICVRYRDRQGWREVEQCRSNCRYDAKAQKRYKTAEIVIEETRWLPPPPRPDAPRPELKVDYVDEPPAQTEVGVKIFFREDKLREQIKAAGGRWLKQDKLWQLPFETAVSLGLEHRIAKR